MRKETENREKVERIWKGRKKRKRVRESKCIDNLSGGR